MEKEKISYQDSMEHLKEILSFAQVCMQAAEKPDKDVIRILRERKHILEVREEQTYLEGRSLPFCQICQAFGLEGFSRFVLLMAAAWEFQLDFQSRLARFQGSPFDWAPILGSLAVIYQQIKDMTDDEWEMMKDMEHPLFRYLFIREKREYGFLTHPCVLDMRIASFLLGRREIPEDFEPLLCCCWWEEGNISIQKKFSESLSVLMTKVLSTQFLTGKIFWLLGGSGAGILQVILQAADKFSYPVIYLRFAKLSGSMTDWKEQADMVAREVILQGALLCVICDGCEEENAVCLQYFLENFRRTFRIVFVISEEKWEDQSGKEHIVYLEIPQVPLHERREIWEKKTEGILLEDDVDIQEISSRYYLTEKELEDILWKAGMYAAAKGSQGINRNHLLTALRDRERILNGYIFKVQLRFSMKDLILESEVKDELLQICSEQKMKGKVMEEWGFNEKFTYGSGCCILFYGEPGTGKTMAAQVLARELGMELYQVDISRMRSKYIGETEKNLTEIFRQAAHKNIILFFDEADALFAKRSEIKDSKDRGANAETAHLLQLLEHYEGITILATNLKESLDTAFFRRIHHMIRFLNPSVKLRRKMWSTMLPPRAGAAEALDLDFWSENFELNGSAVKEILLQAAYQAAAEDKLLENSHIASAVNRYYKKQGRVLAKGELGIYGYL